MHERRGQVLVELALAMPIILLILLGAIETGFLLIAKAHQDRSTAVVADYAAEHDGDDSWKSIAERELPGCDVTMTTTADLVEVTATCHHRAIVMPIWQGLGVTSREVSVIRGDGSPDPTPAASPSSSSIAIPGGRRA